VVDFLKAILHKEYQNQPFDYVLFQCDRRVKSIQSNSMKSGSTMRRILFVN